MAKIKIEEIIETLAIENWKCLSSHYENLDTLMMFECPEGHQVTTTWKKLRSKQECPVCNSNVNKQIYNVKATPKTKAFRILALDQSSKKTGYSVYDGKKLISYGVFESTKDKQLDRMVDLCDWILSMINSWKPDAVGLEETQYNPNMKNRTSGAVQNHDVFKLLSQVMGAAMLTIARENKEVKTTLIPTWRAHCGVKGRGRVDQKRSAQLLVKKWYDISVSDDEADAICIGKYFSDTHSQNVVAIGEWAE